MDKLNYASLISATVVDARTGLRGTVVDESVYGNASSLYRVTWEDSTSTIERLARVHMLDMFRADRVVMPAIYKRLGVKD